MKSLRTTICMIGTSSMKLYPLLASVLTGILDFRVNMPTVHSTVLRFAWFRRSTNITECRSRRNNLPHRNVQNSWSYNFNNVWSIFLLVNNSVPAIINSIWTLHYILSADQDWIRRFITLKRLSSLIVVSNRGELVMKGLSPFSWLPADMSCLIYRFKVYINDKWQL